MLPGEREALRRAGEQGAVLRPAAAVSSSSMGLPVDAARSRARCSWSHVTSSFSSPFFSCARATEAWKWSASMCFDMASAHLLSFYTNAASRTPDGLRIMGTRVSGVCSDATKTGALQTSCQIFRCRQSSAPAGRRSGGGGARR